MSIWHYIVFAAFVFALLAWRYFSFAPWRRKRMIVELLLLALMVITSLVMTMSGTSR